MNGDPEKYFFTAVALIIIEILPIKVVPGNLSTINIF